MITKDCDDNDHLFYRFFVVWNRFVYSRLVFYYYVVQTGAFIISQAQNMFKHQVIHLIPILIAISIIHGCGTSEIKADDLKDYQKMVDGMEWNSPEGNNILFCMLDQLKEYEVEVVRHKHSDFPALTIRICDGKKEIFSHTAHFNTVFLEREGTLYYADFSPFRSGCKIVAYDLKKEKLLWNADLKCAIQGIARDSYNRYRNFVCIKPISDEVIAVFGEETAGRFVEIVDRKTGKTVGHKIFPDSKIEKNGKP